MFVTPTYAEISILKIYIKITPTYFGVNTPSSGSLHVTLGKLMNY